MATKTKVSSKKTKVVPVDEIVKPLENLSEAPKEKKTGKGVFKVTLEIGGENYKASGDDLALTIASLKPKKITNKAVFHLEYEGMTSYFVSMVHRTRMILSNKMTAYIAGRRLMQRLK